MTILARWRTWCTTWYGHEEQDISLIAAKVGATTGSALCYNGENDSSIPWTRWISNRGGWSEGYLFKWCMVLGSPSQHFINKAGDEEDMGGDNISGTSAMGDWIDNTVSQQASDGGTEDGTVATEAATKRITWLDSLGRGTQAVG